VGAPLTTDSRHRLPLVKDRELTGPNQGRAEDITSILPDEGFLYLSLLMDVWSRKIVGFHGGDTLEAEGAVCVLETALSELPEGTFSVHHSERGCQYCSHRYVEKLRAHGLVVSMTEEQHGYENVHTGY
jgi:transposase InsO family protein